MNDIFLKVQHHEPSQLINSWILEVLNITYIAKSTSHLKSESCIFHRVTHTEKDDNWALLPGLVRCVIVSLAALISNAGVEIFTFYMYSSRMLWSRVRERRIYICLATNFISSANAPLSLGAACTISKLSLYFYKLIRRRALHLFNSGRRV
jgi:hypothetical protein